MNAATLSGPDASRSMTPAMKASRLIGWVSFAIGAAQLLAPKRVATAVGIEGQEGLLRASGARGLAAGVGAHSVYPVPALWGRVAGDLLDLGTLAYAGRREDGGRDRGNLIAIAAVAGIAVIDALVAARLSSETREGKGEQRDYSARSGFPTGVESARGAGIVQESFDGKAGGGAAGDSSPAGRSPGGRTMTDLNGAPSAQGASASRGAETPQAERSQGSASPSSGGFIGGGRTMPKESEAVVPQPAGYTPA